MKDRVIAFSPRHWPAVRDILNQCLCQNSATFFHVAPSLADWEQGHLPQGRLLYLDQEGQVQGWAALQPMESPKGSGGKHLCKPDSAGAGDWHYTPLFPFVQRRGIWALPLMGTNIGK